MTPISTYYKLKYYPIGTVGPTSPDPDADKTRTFEDLVAISGIYTDAIKNANNAQLQLNEGMAATRALYTSMHNSVMTVVKDLTSLHEAEKSYIKTFKISTEDLIKRSVKYAAIQDSMKVTNESMHQYQSSMEKFAPLHGKIFADMADGTDVQKNYIKAQMNAYDYLSKNTNLSADSQAKFSLFAASSNTSLQQQVEIYHDIADQLKESIDSGVTFETVVGTIAEMSADVRSQYKKYPLELTKGILTAKKLGTSMTELHNIGKSLLDIEQSTGKELEYQLLSGQRLIKNGKSLTNEYRKAMITGNAGKISAAMKDILDSQSKILDGENMYAKDALAETLGITTERLMQMNEQKKLAEQINTLAAGKIEIDLSKLTDAKIEEIYKKGDTALITAIEDFRKNEQKMLTPADRIDQKFDYIIQKGLRVNLAGDQLSADYLKTVGQYYDDSTKRGNMLYRNKGLTEDLGASQIERKTFNAIEDFTKEYMKGLPLLAATLAKLNEKVNEQGKKILGQEINTQNVNAKTVNVNGTVANTENNEDAVVGINDGIIKFNDRDRLTVVASPFGTMNEKVADKITNPDNKNYSPNLDTNSIVSAIKAGLSNIQTPSATIDNNSIVNAIKAGLSNINVTVNIDPMAIHKEIQFKIG